MADDKQCQFVICVPIGADKDWPGMQVEEVERRLDELQNPATDTIKKALDAEWPGDPPIVHFMSMSVVWDGIDDERAFLIIDISGDGSDQDIVAFLVRRIGNRLLPAFEAARGVQSLVALEGCLMRYTLEHTTHPIQTISRRKSLGLPFPGTPGLTVKRIKKDADIEAVAREALNEVRHLKRSLEPLRCLKHAKAAVASAGLDYTLPKAHRAAPDDRKRSVLLAILNAAVSSWIVNLPTLVAIGAAGVAAFFLVASVIDRRELAESAGEMMRGLPAVLASAGWLLLDTIAVLAVTWILLLMIVLMSALAVGIALGWSAWQLRKRERRDRPQDFDPDSTIVAAIMRRENSATNYEARVAQNHLTAVSTVKPGWFRRWWMLRVGLHVVGLAVASGVFKKGFLSNIGTIHFAQWMRIPGNKLLFLSNYDGSWESYLEDFVTKASEGLTIIWSNTLNFPRTKWLYQDGAKDGDRFKRWVRRQQIPTLFWYSAYPSLTTRQIRDNAEIRYGLANYDTQAEAEEWLAKFGSAPRPATSLEGHEIQRLVFDGLPSLHDGRCLLLRFPEGGDANGWIGSLLRDKVIEFGDEPQDRDAMFAALTWRGLERLGVAGSCPRDAAARPAANGRAELAAQFPAAFVLGMNHHTRRMPLGDIKASSADRWLWGGPGNDVHAVLLIYAKAGTNGAAPPIEELVRIERDRVRNFRLALACEPIEFKPMPANGPMTEPFGFVDGVSQPIISGSDRAARHPGSTDIVEPGEIILGYPDGRACYPPTPQVFERFDTKGELPSLPPDFAATDDEDAEEMRDLGRNGSYLVIRQLEQHVEDFKKFLEDEAERLQLAQQVAEPEEWLAAKMLGRWKNGASLVRHPYVEPEEDNSAAGRKKKAALAQLGEPSPIADNDFLYGRDDPQGLRCPLGAHIRRANPRDSFEPEDPEQLAITNRHRILRRGRVYVDRTENKTGLFFMCLNADIERQFEFVQQAWLGSNAFEGLRNEADVFSQTPPKDCRITIPTTKGPIRVQNLKSFVTVKGGAYFFLPSRRALQFFSRLNERTDTDVDAARAEDVAEADPIVRVAQPNGAGYPRARGA